MPTNGHVRYDKCLVAATGVCVRGGGGGGGAGALTVYHRASSYGQTRNTVNSGLLLEQKK